jgi:hypothetical protein
MCSNDCNFAASRGAEFVAEIGACLARVVDKPTRFSEVCGAPGDRRADLDGLIAVRSSATCRVVSRYEQAEN